MEESLNGNTSDETPPFPPLPSPSPSFIPEYNWLLSRNAEYSSNQLNQNQCLLEYDFTTSLVSVNITTCSPDMTSKKVAELNSVLLADFHKLLKKYQAVRKIVRILTVSVFAFVIIFFIEKFRNIKQE